MQQPLEEGPISIGDILLCVRLALTCFRYSNHGWMPIHAQVLRSTESSPARKWHFSISINMDLGRFLIKANYFLKVFKIVIKCYED